MAELRSLRKPIEDDIYAYDPDYATAGQVETAGLGMPVAAKPEAIVMIHPMVRNYYHIRQIEERTGRLAIAKLGYIELVKP